LSKLLVGAAFTVVVAEVADLGGAGIGRSIGIIAVGRARNAIIVSIAGRDARGTEERSCRTEVV
jgi:hypothetical protein